jgi:hypothetical protein
MERGEQAAVSGSLAVAQPDLLLLTDLVQNSLTKCITCPVDELLCTYFPLFPSQSFN